MFRLLVSSILAFLLAFHSYNHDVLARSLTIEDCITLLNDKVQQDIISSFPFLKNLKKNDSALTFSYEELIKMRIPLGEEETHLNSLISLFHGTSIGNRHLLIINDKYSEKWQNSFTGYLFYKELNGTNILLTIKRGPQKWEVVKRSKVWGRYITFEHISKDCVRNH
ncbi:hypothetical protein [Metabacillus arenae]|uniref:Uncharacterized protein n=1 Tax=Metabacillus arenae TaxID=2771434 RepID=A0A926NMI7_9BACI|nr:hypothetical protein [Metabacillus arenae]MBD1383445.1 hypothetical protein [Metabacillus arenae]